MIAAQRGRVALSSIKPSRHQDQVWRELSGDGHHDYPVRSQEVAVIALCGVARDSKTPNALAQLADFSDLPDLGWPPMSPAHTA
ncbi:hypothetical protein P7K49_018909 [Saguinus oedipus]|uniref:Uncharacterized protein n=1 Tax=Saguinus oedipus TaxID=9490 RepID=A0ABQ9UXN3_SAGOE|nr:hypothetical protein P7K49_018909 [Saguinus oedipus]